MERNAPVLIVDDDPQMAHGMGEVLRRQNYDVDLAGTAEEALDRCASRAYGVVVTDWRLPGMNGDRLIVELRDRRPGTPIVLVTGYASMDSAVHCLRHGVGDYLTKPIAPEALTASVRRLMPEAAERPRSVPASSLPPVAEDPATLRILELARRVAASSATVLLEGESGVGKEVFARFIHDHGPRADGPFRAINCAAIPRDLLEAELFGHVRGAFTGAVRDRPGLFRQADGGTLLLDEIGEMRPDLQSRLLRVLQDRRVQPVGSDRSHEVDVRILAATHRDLASALTDGAFRQDLYYRLRVLPLRIPPLRERPGDLAPLVRRYLDADTAGRITEDAWDRLRTHAWPGNVRELFNVLERAVILAAGGPLDALSIQFDPSGAPGTEPTTTPSLVDAEREAIRRCLASTGGHRGRAAAKLGISQRTLRHKLKQFRDRGLPVETDEGDRDPVAVEV